MEQVLQQPEMEVEKEKEKTLPAYKKLRGHDRWGKPMFVRVDEKIQHILDKAITRNRKKNWDYVAIVAGYCGVGKSVFSQGIARYCDDTFDESRICFTSEEFLKVTNEVEPYSSVILDESFQSMNTRVTMSPDFLKIVNHLQIIRQKHLFIFLCLPNYFDLSKNIAIFRTNHLFVCYSDDDGNRGKVLAFGRKEKKNLYILGGKFLDYGRVRANIRVKFWKDDIVPEEVYENLKIRHLTSQDTYIHKKNAVTTRANLVYFIKKKLKVSNQELAEVSGMTLTQVSHFMKDVTRKFDELTSWGSETGKKGG